MQNIFDDEMQRKRIFKCTLLSTAEISSFTSHEELKLLLDHRMTYIRREQLIFHMSLKNAFLSKFKIDQSICPLGLKMVYTKNYPYQMPRLYFVSEVPAMRVRTSIKCTQWWAATTFARSAPTGLRKCSCPTCSRSSLHSSKGS